MSQIYIWYVLYHSARVFPDVNLSQPQVRHTARKVFKFPSAPETINVAIAAYMSRKFDISATRCHANSGARRARARFKFHFPRTSVPENLLMWRTCIAPGDPDDDVRPCELQIYAIHLQRAGWLFYLQMNGGCDVPRWRRSRSFLIELEKVIGFR